MQTEVDLSCPVDRWSVACADAARPITAVHTRCGGPLPSLASFRELTDSLPNLRSLPCAPGRPVHMAEIKGQKHALE